MLTHLYLLLGCALPLCLTFILLDGGFMNGEHMVFAYSGVIILGIGDTVAALYGKEFGVSLWREGIHKKTQEGSNALMLSVTMIYYGSVCYAYPMFSTWFFMVFLCTIPVAILEGWTSQFDNLVCPIFYFSLLHFMHNYFSSL